LDRCKIKTNFTVIKLNKKMTSLLLSKLPIFLFQMPSGGEMIVLVIGVLVLFGGKKIPEFMRGLGKGMREFNDAKNSVRDELEAGMKEDPKK
jgi:sec-independent protein translocase protein TatA